MSWKGATIGAFVGFAWGGYLGAACCAYFGHQLEESLFRKKSRRMPSVEDNEAGRVFCASAAAMLAKLAKADGVVTRDEIASVERAFARLGFSPSARAYAVSVFRRAKDDNRSIYEYAQHFARVVPSLEVREFLYGLLWDVACADGRVSAAERTILLQITTSLGIASQWFRIHAAERLGERTDGPSSGDTLAEAYSLLGVSPAASDDEVRRAYREKAKKYHPDALRAQGLPDEMVGKATELMSKVNTAWGAIRKSRGL